MQVCTPSSPLQEKDHPVRIRQNEAVFLGWQPSRLVIPFARHRFDLILSPRVKFFPRHAELGRVTLLSPDVEIFTTDTTSYRVHTCMRDRGKSGYEFFLFPIGSVRSAPIVHQQLTLHCHHPFSPALPYNTGHENEPVMSLPGQGMLHMCIGSVGGRHNRKHARSTKIRLSASLPCPPDTAALRLFATFLHT